MHRQQKIFVIQLQTYKIFLWAPTDGKLVVTFLKFKTISLHYVKLQLAYIIPNEDKVN